MTSRPLVRRHVGDVGEDADAGVVDEDVEPAEARDRRRRRRARRRRALRTSACSVSTAPGPAASIFGRAADRCASLRPVIATLTPSATSARAMASPMPRDPPVTIATFPSKRFHALRHPTTIAPPPCRVAIIGAGELGGAAGARARAIRHRAPRRAHRRSTETIGRRRQRRSTSRRRRRSKASRPQLSGSTDLDRAAGASRRDRRSVRGGEWTGDEGAACCCGGSAAGTAGDRGVRGAACARSVERGVRELKIPRQRLFGSAPEALAAAARALVALALQRLAARRRADGARRAARHIGHAVGGRDCRRIRARRVARRADAASAGRTIAACGRPAVRAGRRRRESDRGDCRTIAQLVCCFVAPDDSAGVRARTAALPRPARSRRASSR